LQKDSVEVSAKSIMGVMSLGAEMGSKILIIADGEDEEDALKQIYNLIKSKFGEES
jgi:phosphocarrier protein